MTHRQYVYSSPGSRTRPQEETNCDNGLGQEMILFLTNDPKTVKHLVKLVSLGVYLPSFMRIVHSQSPFSGAPENTNGFTSGVEISSVSHLKEAPSQPKFET